MKKEQSNNQTVENFDLGEEVNSNVTPALASKPLQEPSVKNEQRSNVVVWQHRYKEYRLITSIPDMNAPILPSGTRPKVVIKARNWRTELDLSDPGHKKQHELLLSKPSNDYWLLSDKNKGDKINAEINTLKKLMDMSVPQLMSCIDPQALIDLGLTPGRTDKYELVVAIMRNKKLEVGG